ncbi:MAG: carbon-nitrogen family hydrolase [Chloroflexi bacterium]|nr:carbon-nitrogen family hydrolase [Chloroflexota bacterium]
MNKLSIALAQMDIVLGEPMQNLERARARIDEASERGADVVVLPELWGSAYDLEHAAAHATPLESGLFADIAIAAQEQHIAVVGSLLEASEGRVYNTATFVDARGVCRGVYRKLHLVPMLEEDKYLTPGEEAAVFDTAFGLCGLAVCYDLRFPELWRHYAIGGAVLVFLPSEWPTPRLSHWRTLVPARAIENQIFIAATNRVGSGKGERFGGHSMIVNPWGEMLAEGDEHEGLLVASIDLDEVQETRRRVPVFRDRRPQVYSKWA